MERSSARELATERKRRFNARFVMNHDVLVRLDGRFVVVAGDE